MIFEWFIFKGCGIEDSINKSDKILKFYNYKTKKLKLYNFKELLLQKSLSVHKEFMQMLRTQQTFGIKQAKNRNREFTSEKIQVEKYIKKNHC